MNKVEMKMADNQTEVQIEVMIEDDHISIPSEYFLPTPSSSSIDSDINEIVESSTLNSLMKNNVNDDNNNDDDEITTTNNNSGDNGETINERYGKIIHQNFFFTNFIDKIIAVNVGSVLLPMMKMMKKIPNGFILAVVMAQVRPYFLFFCFLTF